MPGNRMRKPMSRLPAPALMAATILAGCWLAPSAARAQAPSGSYECWFFSSARPGLNFRLTGANYTDSEGKQGAVSSSGSDFALHGAGLDGMRAKFRGGNPATFAILGPRGDEVSFCQLAR